MSADQFRAWRRSMGLKQKDAADLLGLKKRMIQYYEKGNRDGKAVSIPKSVRLACYALTIGISDFDGKVFSKYDPSKYKEEEKPELPEELLPEAEEPNSAEEESV